MRPPKDPFGCGHGNIKRLAQFAQLGQIVLLQRLFQPLVIQLLQRPPDFDGLGVGIGLHRVVHQGKIRPQSLAYRPRHLDVSLGTQATVQLVAPVTPFFHLQTVLNKTIKFGKIRRTYVARYALAESAQQLGDGQIADLAGNIPQRHVGITHHPWMQPVETIGKPQLLKDVLPIQRIDAHQFVPESIEPGRGKGARWTKGITGIGPPFGAIVAEQADQTKLVGLIPGFRPPVELHPVLSRYHEHFPPGTHLLQFDEMDFDFADQHRISFCSSSLCPVAYSFAKIAFRPYFKKLNIKHIA